jgi:hypothetical protein
VGRSGRGWRTGAAITAAAALVLPGSSRDGTKEGRDRDGLTVAVVSSRPEYVTGGDALVAVSLPKGVAIEDVSVSVGGTEVTERFTPDPDDGSRLVGLVDGLPDDAVDISASAGDESASVTVTNHPVTGPLFSGEQLELYACTTESFGLQPSTPARGCAAPTEVTWQYVDGRGRRHELADPTVPPADSAMVEAAGRRVPFVLRTETGTLNRAVYTVTALDPAPDPTGVTVDASAWNGRLVYRFGGGCGASFTQGFTLVDPPPLELLSRGYVTATATFNTFQVLCNDVISAETVSIVKEHVAETYGEPVHTIGEGASGGAMQQLLIAQNYPGLLDAVAPMLPFPDPPSISGGAYDCGLLARYYASPAGAALTPGQRAAINGHAVAGACDLWNSAFGPNADPVRGCFLDPAAFGARGVVPFAGIPPDQVYDPAANPDGWRCTVWETNVAVMGRDPATGFARSAYDNEGVQYGLDALNAGVITPDQFVDLNASIGGFDGDGQPVPERAVATIEVVRRTYRSGRVVGSHGGLPGTPVILVNFYTDLTGDIHDRVRAFSILDRLADGGDDWPDTASLWTLSLPTGDGSSDDTSGPFGGVAVQTTLALDQWLTAAADHREAEGGSWPAAVGATRPGAAESRCQRPEPGAAVVVGPAANDDPACVAAHPVHEEPRMAAGGPRSGDVLKCALQPLGDAADRYEVDLTDVQLDRLAEVFATGVCDYTRPSQGYAEPDHPWYDLGGER